MDQICCPDKCTGCQACVEICLQKAISMALDSEGFLYPQINNEKCIDCNKCKRKCPVLNNYKYEIHDYKKTVYAAKSIYKQDRELSSSGGAFPILARFVINQGGIVVGAAFTEEYNRVQHVAIDEIKQLNKLQGSKYLQSDINGIYSLVKKELCSGRIVLFSGMACQVAGLKAYLGKEYNNLICVDLICMGVPSPLVWGKYIHTYCKGETINSINFKDKRRGWHRFTVVIRTNRREYEQIGKHNVFMQSMFKTYSIRSSCFNCKYKSIDRMADITLSDCWGIEKIDAKLDDNQGVSSIIIQSPKGNEIWKCVSSEFEFIQTSIDDVQKYNPMINTHKQQKKGLRRLFYFLLNHISTRIAFYLICDGWKNTIRKIWRKRM